jgi:hypothetical protein
MAWGTSKTDPLGPGWQPWSILGGPLKSAPVAAQMNNGVTTSSVFYSVDAEGALWAFAQGSKLPYWRSLGAADLAGPLTVVRAADGVRIVAVDRSGQVRTAVHRVDGSLSAWATLGGVQATGTPATVLYPGYRVRVLVRAADGTVRTISQGADGTWPTSWQSTGDFVALGSPAAILDPVTGRTTAVVRGTDKYIWTLSETGQGTDEWGSWQRPSGQGGEPIGERSETDPTVAAVATSNGQTWYIVYRTTSDATVLYERQLPTVTLHQSRAAAKVDAALSFAVHTLPAPTP